MAERRVFLWKRTSARSSSWASVRASVYIYLFFRMLKENKEREDRYQETIDRLSGNIEDGIEKIQNKLESMLNDG